MKVMGALTEAEIFDCLSTNFKLAVQLCEDLAKLPAKGPTYDKFRKTLSLIEGACRQAAYWRGGDARWLTIGMQMAEAHKRAGGWLRGTRTADGRKLIHREGTLHPLFMKLADVMRKGHAAAERLRTTRTGRMGPILPTPLVAPHRTRPVTVTLPSGLIVPSGAM